MKPLWDNLSALFIFLTLFVGELTVQAIYDPRATTTKPPKQRELIIVPWYLSGKDFQPPSDFSQSAKWNQSKDVKGPIVDRPEVKTDWSGQHKTPNFRTDDDQKNEKVDAGDNYESLEQRRDSEEIRGFTDDQNYPSQRLRISHGHRYNEEYESYENVENVRRKGLTEQPEKNIFDGERMENQDVYEDRTMFNKKPHKEKIAKVVTRPSSVVARYDSVLGVQCPYLEATGQFAHPLDCKFFVNCWNGRPFVQPCAPGTLFNPESLECDFPHKVKCYGGELSDLTAPNNLDALERREDLSVTKTEGRYTTANLQTPVCPAHVNGLLQHPTDCTKYLQCANGNTFIMDCGPGTVFNPAISVCDWPRNVYGCEGASKNNEEEVTTWNPPVFDHYDRTNVDVSSSPLDRIQQSAKKVKCPSDYTGLLPYPNDCKKFLQCANGVMHIMDCGPGTVFNPITTVCDWPYNVEGCDKDASKNNEGEVTTWIPPVFDRYDRTNVDVSSSPWDRIQQSAKNIKCPSDYTGLLPYPNDCKKFLQCANGVTYIMDCGPGTVFNPLTTVCDWPYNVEGCDKDETRPKQDIQPGTTAGTQWHENHHINAGNTQDSRESFSHHTDSYDHHHGHISPERQNVDKQHGWYDQREENGQSGQTYQGRDRQTYYDQLNSSKQQNNRHQTGFNNSQYSRHDVLYGTNNGNNRYEGHKEIQHQHAWQREHTDANSGHHYQQQNYHRQQQHHVGSVTGDENGYINGSDYQRFDNKTEDVTSDEPQTVVNESTRWRDHIYRGTVEMNGNTPNHHHHQHHHHHPYHHHTHGHNLNKFGGGEVPEGQNKQNGQRSENTDFPNKKFDYSRPDDNVYVDSNYQLPSESDSLNRESEYNKSLRFGQDGQFERNKTSRENWNQEEIPHTTRFGVFQPSTWGGRDQQSQGSEFQREGHTRHQEELPFPVYYIPPVQQQLRPSYKSSPITPISGQVIRLRGGSSPRSGYLEVQGAKPGWGVVCDSRNSWTLNEAHVVCRQLGYTNGAEMSWQGRTDRENISDWIAANTVYCLGNETAFQSCKFTHGQKCLVERDAIGVQCLPNRVAHCRQDELPHQGQCYHLADSNSSLNHAEALNYCALRKARLLDIVDQAENNFVSEWLVQMHPEVRSIMTSGVGFTIWNRTVFLWEDFSRAKFRYAKWWPGWMEDKKLPPWVGVRPVCVVMKRNFPCHNRPDFTCSTDYFFWDIEDCSTSMKGHSYICKRPYDDIGCIYGKGQQYSGKVNVTSSGQECLPWNDDKVAHYLAVNVASEEIREGLKGHNYCRNPNPNKEWRPWCFTGPYAEREHCDIPSCGKLDTKKSIATGQCKPEHFKCRLGECIPSPWVCDGEKDCIDGADEEACSTHLNLFEKIEKHKLEGYDVEKWLNTPVKTCALRCKEADFTCRSFSHKAENNVCLLSDSNVGLSGALESNNDFNYYEMTERSVNCEKMFVCANRKCVNHAQVCDGKNDCNDHSDEKVCTANNLGYEIRLAGSNNSYEGRVEVKVLGKWGQVCDDGFGMANANVICKELGFDLGAVEIRPGGFYGNLDPPTRFLVDQLKCRGIETSLRECDFDGWGVHNCQPSEAVGIVCKTAVNNCQDGHWKCDNSPECIPMPFICDEVVDCVDGSDENPVHCDAPFELRLVNGSSPLEGRVEVRHHGVWGTVCDDDFSNAAAIVICRSLGYGGLAVAKKNGIFGSGAGPIWLDDVFCNGNESQLYRCEHNPWGQHNCGHDEDAGVICTLGEVTEQSRESISTLPDISIDDILPTNCGQREEDFDDDDNEFLAKVVRGSIAPKGSYPWQASLRVRGHSKSNHWCGAVVLSTLHVLTAAHCLEGYNKGTYFVRAGDYNNEIDEGTEIEANIEDYYIHEDFRKGHRMNNDIALVLLKGRGIPLGRNVMPICLPPENAEYSPGLNCTISGWGSIESGTSIQSRDLRYGWVPLLDQSVCRANYVYGNGAISDGMVCAGYLDEGADSCDGDSGGPLACYHNGAFTLYGVTSWGHHCGRTNKPGVYVRIAYYRRWIDRMLRESLAGR